MHPERKRSKLGIATTGLALIALSYFAKPTLPSSYGRGVQVQPESITVPFGDVTFAQRVQGTVPSPANPELNCGLYPDETDDPYLAEQKSMTVDTTYDESGTPQECADLYVGYDYIARRLERQIPKDQRRPVTLVIMDSGINAEHEDWCEGQIDEELSKTFLDSVDIHTSSLTDEVGHGSSVAGIAGACSGNGIGIASLGRGIDVASLKVMFPYGGGGIVNPSDWREALEYLDAQARSDANRQFVLNMSFAGFGNIASIEKLINNMPENVSMFAGAGNNPYGTPYNGLDYPANYDRIYAVGATVDDTPDALCGFSYYSTTKDRFIAAPGCFDLWGFQNLNNGSFAYRDGLSGTSFSDPNLSGMYTYFLHIFPMLSPDEIMQTIVDTAQPVQQASQGTIDQPLKAISPLHAIRALAVKAGFQALIKPPEEDHKYYLPVVER